MKLLLGSFSKKHAALFSILAIAIITALILSALRSNSVSVSAQDSRPNIVVIMTDDQNVDSLPVMRKLMSFPEGSWVNFTNAITNDSICCPSRATFLTGQYSHEHGVIRNGMGKNLNVNNTLAVWLDNAGYRTGLIGKYQNGFPWNLPASYKPPGWDYFNGGGGLVDGIIDEALSFINTSQEPFFLSFDPVDPHFYANPPQRYENTDVYMPPNTPNFNEADVSDKPTWIKELPLLSQSKINSWTTERRNSQRALLAVDDAVQRIVDSLKAKGQLDNTMIIFMADHGFSWGSHRWIKKHCPYDECSKFPLVIRYPGLAGNREESRLVSSVDIPTTIAAYAGVTPGLVQRGRSIIPVLTNIASAWDESVFIEKHADARVEDGYYGVRTRDWLYVEFDNAANEKELYDLVNDPYQLVNLANRSAYQSIQNQLRNKMQDLLENGPVVTTPTITITPSPTNTPPVESPTPTPEITEEPTPTATDEATPTVTTAPTPTISITPTPKPNILSNADFESTLSPWQLLRADSGTLTRVSPGFNSSFAALATIQNASLNSYVQQKNITLKANTQYTLTFDVKASRVTKLELFLTSNTTGNNYGINKVIKNLSTDWQTQIHTFTTSGFSGTVSDARLRIWFDSFDQNGDKIWLDNISLAESN